ncbi:MAG: mechanosensitive ion channel, partial [Deltaproteobacteria bacterium]|nr:mechanosensitive ion channel [Deltaproteobacteria bacterium]
MSMHRFFFVVVLIFLSCGAWAQESKTSSERNDKKTSSPRREKAKPLFKKESATSKKTSSPKTGTENPAQTESTSTGSGSKSTQKKREIDLVNKRSTPESLDGDATDTLGRNAPRENPKGTTPTPVAGTPKGKSSTTKQGSATSSPGKRNRKKSSKGSKVPLSKEAKGAGVMDAGSKDGGVSDAGNADAGSVEEKPKTFPVQYHGNDSPLIFEVEVGGRKPQERAAKASVALTAALDADVKADELVPRVDVERGVVAVWVGKSLITQLYPADAEATGLQVQPYAENLDAKLKAYVPAQLRRRAVQLFALHIFLSVFFGVAGFLTLRFLRRTFNRWDEEFDERRGQLAAISIFKIPIFSSDAVGGTLAFALAVGRITSYVVVFSVSFGAMLSQFAFTRPILRRVIGWSGGPILKAVEDVVTSVPGLIFVTIAIVSLRGLLRVMNLLLDGVSKKRIQYKPLPPSKVPVFRFVVSALSVILIAPLLVAAAFGRWGTPWEILALALGLAVVVASIPQFANYVTGVAVVWREGIKPGDWVEVGDYSGEITHVDFHELSLVPEGGGTILVPMIYLVTHPLHRLREPPAVSFELTVARDRPSRELMKALRNAMKAKEPDAKAECVDICHAWIRVRVSAPSIRPGVQETLLMALSDAVDSHEFELPIRQGFTRRGARDDLNDSVLEDFREEQDSPPATAKDTKDKDKDKDKDK